MVHTMIEIKDLLETSLRCFVFTPDSVVAFVQFRLISGAVVFSTGLLDGGGGVNQVLPRRQFSIIRELYNCKPPRLPPLLLPLPRP